MPNHGIDYYPLGHIPAAVYIVIIAYTMIKHHLLDINVVIKKSIIYSLLLILISIVFIAAVFLIERFTQMVIGYNTIILSLTFAVLIALLLSPLKLVIQNFVDKIIFKATPAELSSKNELLLERISQSEKLKTAATFASGIAHEIKNPLTAIKTFSEFLPSKKDDHDFLDRFSKIVGKEVARIDDLVNQLLEYAKPAPLILKNINILKLISETLDFLSSEFIKHQIRVERNWSQATSILIKIDSNKFRQAYLNIFLNAIDAMPQGGTLKISAEILKASSSRLMIKIQDTGCGIKPKDLPHIFEPFFSKKDKGTGLGLAITQKIIMDHGGDIIVESQEGKGSLFEISLPLESGPGTEGD